MTGGNALSREVINMRDYLPVVEEVVDACGIKFKHDGKMNLGVRAYHLRIPRWAYPWEGG